jgi:hypothetical protein
MTRLLYVCTVATPDHPGPADSAIVSPGEYTWAT